MKALTSLILPVILLTGCSSSPTISPGGVNTPPPDINAWLKPRSEKPDSLSETRWKMLTDAGKTLGFRGGKAQRSWELIQALNARESTLNALYDFRPLISPEGWLPPVIDEAQDVAHITPDQIRTSSRVWTIIRPERFVSNPPGWRDWLLRGLSTTATPGTEGSVVPEDSVQRKVWETALRQGWQEGRQNADLTLEANQKTLTRDYWIYTRSGVKYVVRQNGTAHRVTGNPTCLKMPSQRDIAGLTMNPYYMLLHCICSYSTRR